MRETTKQGRPGRPETTRPESPAMVMSAGFKAALGGTAKKPHLVGEEAAMGKKALRSIEKDSAKPMLRHAHKPGGMSGPRKGHR